MDEIGRLQGVVGPFTTQVGGGQSFELAVHELQQARFHISLAVLKRVQQRRISPGPPLMWSAPNYGTTARCASSMLG